jgi:hypothetical protein
MSNHALSKNAYHIANQHYRIDVYDDFVFGVGFCTL